MCSVLFRPLTTTDEMQHQWSDGTSVSEFVESFVKPNDRLTSFERLEIYNRQYWFRALDSMSEDFPGLCALLGQKKFHALSVAYLTEHQSASWTLRNLGSRLPQFIEDNPQLTKPKTAMAQDMTRFEWAQILAFDEARLAPLEGDGLLGSDAAIMRLGLQPYLSLLELHYEVDEFALALKKNEQSMRSGASNALNEASKPVASKRVKAPNKRKIWLVVHRFHNSVYYKRLEREGFLMLGALRDGLSVAAAVEHALADANAEEDWASKIKMWFENWASLGWFCRPQTRNSKSKLTP